MGFKTGFADANYTKMPNDLFEMMSDMKDTELRVIIALCRFTFGYHRNSASASIADLQKWTGLRSHNSVLE